MPLPEPPAAPRRPHELVAHGHTRVDNYYWLGDRDDPATTEYLLAENDYAQAVLSPTEDLQSTLFEEIRGRIRETDAGAPTRHGPWWYFTRTEADKQYTVLARRPDPERLLDAGQVAADARAGRATSGEEVVLDENALAAGSDYFAVGVLDISPDHNILAYATDFDGSEKYTLRFRDLTTGQDLDDVVDGVYYGSAWASDNLTFFYIRPDEAMRPWQVWCHQLGAHRPDRLVYQEDDERFFVAVERSRSEQVIVIHAGSRTTSEAWWIDATRPEEPARAVVPRRPGVEYDVEHDGTGWLVKTNQPGPGGAEHVNFALYRLIDGGPGQTDTARMVEVLPHRPDVKLESVDAFANFVVVGERSEGDGLERLRILERGHHGLPVGDGKVIDQPEPVYSLLGASNPDWDGRSYRFGYTSLVTPVSSIDYEVITGRRTTVWSQIVAGGFDPGQYRTERLWAVTGDGTRVPLSVVARRDQPLDGSAPCLLYGYGTYEHSIDPSFSSLRISLLERGITFAIAHVRGGGELGRTWYEQGKMEHKVNTFSDFIAAAEHLVASGWARPDAIVARGGSAGGLLMGVVNNWRPDLWRAVVAEVPFVDVVTTMSDTELPLTVTEWEEWGDPVHDADAYRRMLAYSPYDNVEAQRYPAMFVTAGLNDPRVGYWEPAKWVARLRSVGAGAGDRPLILRTEMGAGHQGASGRYDSWRDEARVQAFVLTQMNLA